MITRQQAMRARHGEEVYSMKRTYERPRSDGLKEPRRARVSGRCRTWRSQPDAFRLPIKLSSFTVSEIDQRSAKDWTFDKQEALRAVNPTYDIVCSGIQEWKDAYDELTPEQQAVVHERLNRDQSLSIEDLQQIAQEVPS